MLNIWLPREADRITCQRRGDGRWTFLGIMAVVGTVAAIAAVPALAAAPSPAALQAALAADASLRFRSLVTALSTAPDNPADFAVTFANGSAEVVQEGHVVLHLPASPAPVTALHWLRGATFSYVLYGRTTSGVTRYTVAAVQGSAPPQRLHRCLGARGTGVSAGGDITWRCGQSLYIAGPGSTSFGPGGPLRFMLPRIHWTLTSPPAAGSDATAPLAQDSQVIAVDNAGGVVHVQAPLSGGVTPFPRGALDAGPGPVHMAWSPNDALAVAGPRGLFLWSAALGLHRFPGVRNVRQLLWTADGLHVEVLRRLNPGASPPDYAVQQLGLDGSARTLLSGRLGFVLGLSADGSVLWREEGVAAGICTQGPAGAGAGPFRLQAVPLPTPPPSTVAPLAATGPLAAAGSALAWMLEPGGGLLPTTDGGATWSEGAPAGYAIAPGASGATTAPEPSPPIAVGGPATLTLLHAGACAGPACYDGWSYATAPGGTPTILFTPNGAASWVDLHPSGLPFAAAGTRPPALQFVNPASGWLATFPCCQGRTETQEVALFRTADGGRSWAAAGAVWTHIAGHTPPPGSPAPHGIPVSFGARGARTAWVTGVAARQPWLYATADGGATWRNVRLPAPRGFGHTFTLTEPPHFFAARDGILPVLCGVKLRRFGGGWQWVAFPEFAAAGGPALVLYQTRWTAGSATRWCCTRATTRLLPRANTWSATSAATPSPCRRAPCSGSRGWRGGATARRTLARWRAPPHGSRRSGPMRCPGRPCHSPAAWPSLRTPTPWRCAIPAPSASARLTPPTKPSRHGACRRQAPCPSRGLATGRCA